MLLAFTDASGNPVSSYVTNSGVYVSLTDLIQNTNANTVQTVTVNVTNLSNGDVESVVLTETGTNTGIFRNTTRVADVHHDRHQQVRRHAPRAGGPTSCR